MMWRTIILLFLALPLSGQQGMLLVGGGEAELGDLLLDSFPGAVAAYSVRQLYKDYDGPCMRIVRNSDASSLNVGFLASGDLDTVSINSFCSGTDCVVDWWFDQSINNDSLSTPGINPQITASSSIIRKNGKPSISLSGSAYFSGSVISALSTDSISSHFAVAAGPASSAGPIFSTDNVTSARRIAIYVDTRSASPYRHFIIQTTVASYFADLSSSNTSTGIRLLSSVKVGTTGAMSAWDNGNTGGTATYSGTYNNVSFLVGRQIAGSLYLNGHISELIIFRDDQSANRTAIETNINNYYSIY